MHSFITGHAKKVTGVLRSFAGGVEAFWRRQGALMKGFEDVAKSVTALIVDPCVGGRRG